MKQIYIGPVLYDSWPLTHTFLLFFPENWPTPIFFAAHRN